MINVRRPKSVDAKIIDPREDFQVYCTANQINTTDQRKRELVTQMLLIAKHQQETCIENDFSLKQHSSDRQINQMNLLKKC